MQIGKNWWCSLFPALCFTDVSSGYINEEANNILKENLNNEEYDLLTNKSPKIQIKFKILEIFSN